ncbi:hypothetical protein NMY22_g1579 [Coprinellus aureogranulatus]|nr:hypothetical protein NMY22_g1579 [Coprinellus aureogranulatus]
MITVYDFDSTAPGRAMSPFVWRIRYALNIKGLEHRTEWLNYGKLEEQLQERNAAPTRFLPDGAPVYTVPAIYDPSTNTTISDSQQILKYLDDAYPDAPQLCAPPYPNDDSVKAAFESTWPVPLSAFMLNGTWGLLVPIIVDHIDEASGTKYKQRFEAKSGMSFESLSDISVKSELLVEGACRFKEADRQLEEIRQKYGGDGPWLLGDEVKVPDLAVVGTLAYIAAVLGENSQLWKEIRELDDGRWGKRWDEFRPYHILH